MTVFVWVRSPRGPAPQKWAEMLRKDHSADGSRVLAHHNLTAEEEALSLDQLAAKYPAPAQEEEADHEI